MDFRDVKEFLIDSAKYLLIVVIAFLIFIYVVSFQQVIGPSMNPNYNEGEIWLLNKIKYHIWSPKRFEVIVLDSKESKFMIKRVIGLPGEHISYKDDILYVNGKKIEEKFKRASKTDDFDLKILKYDIIPEDYYLVLGDNRADSLDSRRLGLISKKDIIGKVEFRIWPIFKK